MSSFDRVYMLRSKPLWSCSPFVACPAGCRKPKLKSNTKFNKFHKKITIKPKFTSEFEDARAQVRVYCAFQLSQNQCAQNARSH